MHVLAGDGNMSARGSHAWNSRSNVTCTEQHANASKCTYTLRNLLGRALALPAEKHLHLALRALGVGLVPCPRLAAMPNGRRSYTG